MNGYTRVRIVITTDLYPPDRKLVGGLIASAFVELDYPADDIFVDFTGTVTEEEYSALCILENIGLLTVEQV